MTAADAVGVTRDYLARQQSQIAAPELHIPAEITGVWAITAAQARTLDGCIPAEASDQIVWVTKSVGDYLNLTDHPWSSAEPQATDPLALACGGPGPAGTLVIDDATGQILGVYPTQAGYPHPTPQEPSGP